MKDNPHSENKELLRIISILKREIEFLKEENDICMNQIELLVRKNNNIMRKLKNLNLGELNSPPEDLRYLLPDHLQNKSEDYSVGMYDNIIQNKAGSLPPEAKYIQKEGNLKQKEGNLIQKEGSLIQKEDSLKERKLSAKQIKDTNIHAEDKMNRPEDSLIASGDSKIQNDYNDKTREEIRNKINDLPLSPEDSNEVMEDNLKSGKDRINSAKGSISETEDSVKQMEDNEHNANDTMNEKRNAEISDKDRLTVLKDSITRYKDTSGIAQDSVNSDNDRIDSPEDSKNREEDNMEDTKYSLPALRNIEIQKKYDEIESGDYEFLEEDSKESNLPVPLKKYSESLELKAKPKLHEVSEEIKILRKKVEESLTASLRKKYMKQMIRRWVNMLIYFKEHDRVKGSELMHAMGIRTATLMRDTTLFKNKGWIKYYGTKKNGYYKITEEGMEFLKREV